MVIVRIIRMGPPTLANSTPFTVYYLAAATLLVEHSYAVFSVLLFPVGQLPGCLFNGGAGVWNSRRVFGGRPVVHAETNVPAAVVVFVPLYPAMVTLEATDAFQKQRVYLVSLSRSVK